MLPFSGKNKIKEKKLGNHKVLVLFEAVIVKTC